MLRCTTLSAITRYALEAWSVNKLCNCEDIVNGETLLRPHHPKLDALRRVMAEMGLDGFLVPRADEHLGEYVPPCAERLAWLTGFTGSAGLAVVLRDRAAAFTDGR